MGVLPLLVATHAEIPGYFFLSFLGFLVSLFWAPLPFAMIVPRF
jgi:hypothetical protein